MAVFKSGWVQKLGEDSNFHPNGLAPIILLNKIKKELTEPTEFRFCRLCFTIVKPKVLYSPGQVV